MDQVAILYERGAFYCQPDVLLDVSAAGLRVDGSAFECLAKAYGASRNPIAVSVFKSHSKEEGWLCE